MTVGCAENLRAAAIRALLDRGIYMTPSNGLHWIISTAHTPVDVEALLTAVNDACVEMT